MTPDTRETLTIPISGDELAWVRHAAGLRRLSLAEYVRRAINLSLSREGVDAVLLKESGQLR